MQWRVLTLKPSSSVKFDISEAHPCCAYMLLIVNNDITIQCKVHSTVPILLCAIVPLGPEAQSRRCKLKTSLGLDLRQLRFPCATIFLSQLTDQLGDKAVKQCTSFRGYVSQHTSVEYDIGVTAALICA